MTLIENGDLWCEILSPGFPEESPALFLDRDGTLIELADYLSDPDGVTLIETAVADIRGANIGGHAVVIVTNQSGIGRGYYGWDDFCAVQAP